MLERERHGASDDETSSVSRTTGRFANVAVNATVAVEAESPPPAVAQVDRFSPPLADSTGQGAALEIDAASDNRPSIRCFACHKENSRFATRCTACAASLTSRAAIRFNRQIHDDERAAARVANEAPAADPVTQRTDDGDVIDIDTSDAVRWLVQAQSLRIFGLSIGATVAVRLFIKGNVLGGVLVLFAMIGGEMVRARWRPR